MRRFHDEAGGFHACFLKKLAPGRLKRGLSPVDAALRHLPEMLRAVHLSFRLGYPVSGPDEALTVENHHADAGTVRKAVGRNYSWVRQS